MTAQPSKYRFLLINAFSLAPGSDFQLRSFTGPKETQLYNYEDLKPFLADIDWELHPGARATHGNWPVATKEAFMLVGNNRLPLEIEGASVKLDSQCTRTSSSLARSAFCGLFQKLDAIRATRASATFSR